jgi:hypothetical protein
MFSRILSGPNKGKYVTPFGDIYTPEEVQIYRSTGILPTKPAIKAA